MNEFLEIGRISKIHGLKGMVRAISYLSRETVISAGETLMLATKGEEFHYKVQTFQTKGTTILLKFLGVDSPEAAQKLIGATIKRPRSQFAPLEEGEYYWSDLLGMEVRNETGETIGRIESIIATGSNDVFICGRDEREVLIPAIAEVVISVDLKSKLMTVRLPEVV